MESTKRCPFCGEEILDVAIKCKHCHSDLTTASSMAPASARKTPIVRPFFGMLALTGAAIVSLAYCTAVTSTNEANGYVSGNPARSPVAEPPELLPTQTPKSKSVTLGRTQGKLSATDRAIYRTTAETLYRDYENNEVATDQRIGTSTIEITGTVKAIDKDFLGQPAIKLDVGDEFNSVTLTMNKSQTSVAGTLSKGQSVRARCDKMVRIINFPEGQECHFLTN